MMMFPHPGMESIMRETKKPSTDQREGTAGGPQRSEGERSEPERSGGHTAVAAGQTPSPQRPSPDPEVPAKAKRRRFSAKYKRRILEEIDRCTTKGQVGAILRREGLYSSHVSSWRRQREKGELKALSPKKRGRKAKPVNPLAKEVSQLQRENERLRKKLKQAEIIIEFQKKTSEVLGITLESPENGDES
jgi:transposase-like protein